MVCAICDQSGAEASRCPVGNKIDSNLTFTILSAQGSILPAVATVYGVGGSMSDDGITNNDDEENFTPSTHTSPTDPHKSMDGEKSAETLVQAPSGPTPKKRACLSCKHLKKKCNGLLPCSSCMSRGRHCVFSDPSSPGCPGSSKRLSLKEEWLMTHYPHLLQPSLNQMHVNSHPHLNYTSGHLSLLHHLDAVAAAGGVWPNHRSFQVPPTT